MTEVFNEVKRVLREDGTCWLNIGDSYTSHKPRSKSNHEVSDPTKDQSPAFKAMQSTVDLRSKGFKDKDLLMIPHRVAMSLQSEGWYIRSDIVWQKVNCMPSSVKDRPTNSKEFVFLLSKTKHYFYDAYAVREPHQTKNLEYEMRKGSKWGKKKKETCKPNIEDYVEETKAYNPKGRNKRDVWSINTKPYRGAHFAVMPPELIDTCLKAGTCEVGCCGECGTPYSKVYEGKVITGGYGSKNVGRGGRELIEGWNKGCDCSSEEVKPCVVLDPFGGSGTTALSAVLLGQDSILCELNSDYLSLIKERIKTVQGLMRKVSIEIS